MEISKVGPIIVLPKVPKSVWVCFALWMLFFSLNEGLDLLLTLSDFGCSVEYVEVVLPDTVDRSI
ncbi:hypothetical protein [Pseudomonas sp. 18175]|uniref:hypothetical protein n=1 Tax=Pseudomonas sp. 18175 TaxID=3390056 RepID=UPI003D1F32B0